MSLEAAGVLEQALEEAHTGYVWPVPCTHVEVRGQVGRFFSPSAMWVPGG